MIKPEIGASLVNSGKSSRLHITQDVAVRIRKLEDLLVSRRRRQDIPQTDDLMSHRFQHESRVLRDVAFEEESPASGCI